MEAAVKEFSDFPPLLAEAYRNATRPVCQRFGLTASELDIVLFLANQPQYDRATDIVEKRFIAKSQVSASVASLQKRGYLVCESSRSDRRTVHLKLTDAARDAVSSGRQAQERFFAALLRGFSESDREKMLENFRKITHNLQNFLKED